MPAANVKGFGCRPLTDSAMHSGGRRPKASKERNRGNGYERRCGALYGDLTAAAGAPEGSGCAQAW